MPATKIKGLIRSILRTDAGSTKPVPRDMDAEAGEIIQSVKPFTMTSMERLFALISAVRYIERARIPGAIVECGVWRGGSMMAAAQTLLRAGRVDRELVLCDTFEGMPKPTESDIDPRGKPAAETFTRTQTAADASDWCFASDAEVRRNLNATGYDPQKVRLVKGKVETTLPGAAPEQIAILRLDTDWYESTKHELVHLYPRLVSGGVLIIDDYGYWQGSRRATDEYIAEQNLPILLNRIDTTGRIAVKP